MCWAGASYSQVDVGQIFESLAEQAAGDTAEDIKYKENRMESFFSEGEPESGDEIHKITGVDPLTAVHNTSFYEVRAAKIAKDNGVDIPAVKIAPQLYYPDNLQLYELNPLTHNERRGGLAGDWYDLPSESTINTPTPPAVTKVRTTPEP